MKFRKANKEDVVDIVRMIANDKLGALREEFKEPLTDKYYGAFENINNDVNQELMVVVNEKKEIIGTFQLSFIQYLTYQGGVRAQMEGVRVRDDQRGKGVGEKMFRWAIQRSEEKGAHLLQLTTDRKRPEALKFYKRLGFVASHEGLKLHFDKK